MTNPFAPRRYGELQKITERVYIFRNITNSSFVLGDDGVAVIDTQVNLPTASELLRCIRSVTSKPIRFVINTHYHWDHTNGNELFKKEGAEIVSSKLTKDFMTRRAPRQKEFLAGRGFELGRDPFLPEVVFEKEHTVDLGGMPLRLFFAGRAETDDATAVHVVREGIVMSGDTVMTGSFPIFGQPVWDEGLEGNGEWEKTLEVIASLKPEHIIPGHGPLAHEKELELLLLIQTYFVSEVKTRVLKGLSLGEILKDMEPRLPAWIRDMPIVWGTPRYAILRVYRGLTKKNGDAEPGWQQYKPSAIPSVPNDALRKAIQGKEELQDFLAMAHEAGEGGDGAMRLAILKKAADLFMGSPDALAAYADALIDASRSEASVLEKGDFFSEAKRCWDSALRMDPVHVPSLLGRGRYFCMMAYRGGDDPSAGMSLLEKVKDLRPSARERAEAEFYLGMGHRRLGDETKALARFTASRAADPLFMPAVLAAQV